MIEQAVRILPVLLAVTGGIIDRLSSRIPNWLTIPGLAIGIAFEYMVDLKLIVALGAFYAEQAV